MVLRHVAESALTVAPDFRRPGFRRGPSGLRPRNSGRRRAWWPAYGNPQPRAPVGAGGGDVVEDQVEQRVQIIARTVEFGIRPSRRGPRRRDAGSRAGSSLASSAAKRSNTSLSARSGSASGLVDLVQDHDGTQAERQRLLRDELRLRHRALCGIDQQHHAVHHAQDPPPRSTSPPKSAWPGVSTILMRVPFHSTLVALARDRDPAPRVRGRWSPSRVRATA